MIASFAMKTVAVIGAGTMGAGIAQVALQAGCTVRLCDAMPEALARGKASVSDGLRRLVEKGKLAAADREAALGRLSLVEDLAQAARGADLVVEAVPEDLALKQRTFAALSSAAPPDALLCTNTSALSIARIAEMARGPERVLGLHFFNPPPVMKLVEVVRGPVTSDTAVERAVQWARDLGKEPIVVRDAPGFASSRLGIALAMEAIRMLEDGVASAADIDKAMKLGYGHPMGPLELTDLVGLDVRLAIAEHLERELGARYRPPELLRRLVSEGKLGKKSGEGFYKYP